MTAPFHLLAKPVGPRCNMACRYCFYLEKAALDGVGGGGGRMSDAVLEAYIRETAAAQPGRVEFAFQGGEPTLAGLDFLRRAVELARRHCGSREFSVALQTNGLLLDDEWCAFLAEARVLVGISLDGPRRLHDLHRVDRAGRPHYDEVAGAIARLQRHGVAFNVLSTVTAATAPHGLEIYRHLRSLGARYLQFIPIVEREPDDAARALGLDLGAPDRSGPPGAVRLMPWSVGGAEYGAFLCDIFDEWVRRDVGRVFVQAFDAALANWMNTGGTVCQFAPECGRSLAIERNGDVYACDHYVYPAYRRGNILERPLAEMVDDPAQVRFGRDKADALPDGCRRCEHLFLCRGDCPKHRLVVDPGETRPRSHLCAGYRRFFAHIAPQLEAMAALVRAGRPAADLLRAAAPSAGAGTSGGGAAEPGRNSPCPCGSGRKFKQCCGRR